MPTPASGTISMNNMNTEILRASGTATVSMSTIRTRYGGSGAISFSDLRNAEGFTISAARYYESSKFYSANNDGWNSGGFQGTFGTITPNEANGMLQFAANSFLKGIIEDNLFDPGITVLYLDNDTDPTDFNDQDGVTITAGYKGSNITRIVLANTSYTINSSGNTFATVTYNMPNTGTLHCLVKF